LDEKQFQFFNHVKKMDRTCIPRGGSEFKFMAKRHMKQPRTRRLSQVLENIINRGKSKQETEKEELWEERRDWRSFVH
jgi:hypothetical protein